MSKNGTNITTSYNPENGGCKEKKLFVFNSLTTLITFKIKMEVKGGYRVEKGYIGIFGVRGCKAKLEGPFQGLNPCPR